MKTIRKLEVKELANIDDIIWLTLSSTNELSVDDQLLLVDSDKEEPLIKGAIIIETDHTQKRVKVQLVFSID